MTNFEIVMDDLELCYQPTTEPIRRARALESLSVIYDALREKQARENPKPLTLNQLRERNGKPVFMLDEDEPTNHGWMIWEQEHTDTWLSDHSFIEAMKNGAVQFFDHEPKEKGE